LSRIADEPRRDVPEPGGAPCSLRGGAGEPGVAADEPSPRPPHRDGPVRRALKRPLIALVRPGLVDVERRLAAMEDFLRCNRPSSWRGGLSGALVSPFADSHLQRRLRDELAFWRRAAAGEGLGGVHGPLHEVFARWQAGRMAELAAWLGLQTPEEVERWRRSVRAVEVGAGPHPFLLVGEWKSQVAVDPLADGYRAEGLLCDLGSLVYVCASAEEIPLPGESADLVVTHNCLDHVDDPGAAVAEMGRLLAPGALLWLFVDLRSTTDDLHPHALSADLVRTMLTNAGLSRLRESEQGRGSAPGAPGEYRGLWRRGGKGKRVENRE
jgi:SAM-dependent methyltransferase